MKREKIRKRKVLIFAVLFAILALNVCVGCTSAATYTVCPSGCNHTSIQAAIGVADSGDTIEVYSGTYYENVNVTKQLILKSVDTGGGKPVVAAGGNGSAITLSTDGITLDGFNATNSGSSLGDAGIKVISNNNSITGNIVCNNYKRGIMLSESSNNLITGNNVRDNDNLGINLAVNNSNNSITANNFSNNGYGIRSGGLSNNNNYTGNYFNSSKWHGISLMSSSNNTITGNTFVNDGLTVQYSFQNTVEGNVINGKPLVYFEDTSDIEVTDAGQVILVNCNNIKVENLNLSCTSVGLQLLMTEDSIISNNTVSSNNNDGICLASSCNNAITGNNVSNNHDGIKLWFSRNNNVTGNNVCNNSHGSGIHLVCDNSNNNITGNILDNNWQGIHLWCDNNDNTLTGNVVSNNDDGIYLYAASDNKIYLNDFINNAVNVNSAYSTNVWNSTKPIAYQYSGSAFTSCMGNYWSDYIFEGNDTDGNGIGDTAYSIGSDNDTCPLMEPVKNYFAEEEPPAITSFHPPASVSDVEGATRTFNLTIDQQVNVSWLINGTEVQENVSVTAASYTNTSAAIGTWNVSAIASNEYGSDMQVWIWNVTSLPYTHTDAGVTVDIELTESSEIAPLLPSGTDISTAIVIRVNVTDATPENSTDDAYTDITINVGELDVETCEVYKEGSGFLHQVDDVATLPTVNSETKFSRDVANNSVIVRLYVGDPLIGVISSVIEGVFDTGKGIYPSIMGTHEGTITPSHNLTVSKLYTYPCAGTGGHTESIELYENGTLIANGTWNGYQSDWHNITLNNVTDGTSYVTLLQDHEYNYTICTGSYPQILHATSKEVTCGTITCTQFRDANGNKYNDWIPAIKFF